MSDFSNPYRPLLSLADAKTLSIGDKLHAKQKKLNPSLPTDAEVAAAEEAMRGADTGLADLGEAALYRSGGLVMDALKGLSNAALDTEFDDTAATGWSNQATADVMAGVTPEYRQQLQEDQMKVVEAAADDRYLDSLAAAWNVAPRTLMDSAGVIPELLAGSAITAAGAALVPGAGAAPGLALLGRRGQKVVEGAESIFGTYQDATKLRKTRKAFRKPAHIMEQSAKSALKNDTKVMNSFLGEAAKSGAKAVGQTSFINMEMTQNSRNQYIEEYGEEPTPERVAAMALTNAVTLSVQPAIWKKLYLPKLPGVKTEKGARLQGIRKHFEDNLKQIAKTADRGMLENMARAIGSGAAKVAKAGGAEAVQEYAQSWGEILSTHVHPEKDQGFWNGVMKQLQDEGNINESTAAAFMGGMAGGQLRGITAAPTAGARVGLEAAAKTGKKIADTVEKRVAIKDFGALTPEKKAELAKKVELDEAAFEAQDAQSKADVAELTAAQSYADIKSDRVKKDLLNAAKVEDITDPEVWAEVKKGQLGQYKAQANWLKSKRKVSAVGRLAKEHVKQGAKDVVKKVKEQLPENWQEKLVDLEIKAQNLGDDAVQLVKDVDTEQVRGFIDLAVDDTVMSTKAGLKKLRAEAMKQESSLLRKTAKAIEGNAPERARILTEEANRIDDRERRIGLKSDRITTFDKLSTPTKEIAQKGFGQQSVIASGSRLMDEIRTKPGDSETVATLQKALDRYEQTTEYKEQKVKGVITPTMMKTARKKLSKDQDLLATPVRDTVEGIATNLAKRGLTAAGELPGLLKKAPAAAKAVYEDFTLGKQKEMYKVKASSTGRAFLESLEKTENDLKKMGPEDHKATMTDLLDLYTSKEFVARFPDLFDTRDPAVFAEIITEYLPVPKEALTKGISENLEAPSSQLTEKARTKDIKKDTIPLTPSGKIRLNEAGDLTVDKSVPAGTFDKLSAFMDTVNVCSK